MTACVALHQPEPAPAALTPENLYASLMQRSPGLPNSRTFSCLISSLYKWLGVMPSRLGLSHSDFHAVLERHFSGLALPADRRPELPLERSEEIEIINADIPALLEAAGVVKQAQAA